MSISSDEVNFLIYRYLQENGFSHSAFTFAYESLVIKSSVAQTEIPPGALITFLQKGLEYIAIEEHINEDGSIQEFDNNYSLLSPLVSEAVAVKEDRRVIKHPPAQNSTNNNSAQSTDKSSSSNRDSKQSDTVMDVDQTEELNTGEESNSSGTTSSALKPSEIQLINGPDNTARSRYLKLTGHQGEVFMCVWNPVRKQLASGSADGMCRLWGLWEMDSARWESKETELTLSTAIMPHSTTEGEKYKDVTSVTWSPDGQFLATGCYDGMARIWDNQGKLVTLLKEHTGPVFSLKWNKTGNYILSGSYDRRAIVWDVSTGAVVKSFMLHAGPVLDVDWKDANVFATCSSDRVIYICQISADDSANAVQTLTGHEDEVNAVCWSAGGSLLASCSDDSTAKIWGADGTLRHDLKGHAKEIFTLRWTPTGAGSINPDKTLFLCTASFDGTVKVWSGVTGQMVYNLCKQVQPVYSLAPSPNGEFIATGSLGGNVSIWSLTKGELLKETQGSGDTFDVSWSYDGTLLCSCFSSGTLYVLDTATL